MEVVLTPQEHTPDEIARNAILLQAEFDAVSAELKTLMNTVEYAYAMSSVDSMSLPQTLQAVRDRADELYLRCLDIKQQIAQLFEV